MIYTYTFATHDSGMDSPINGIYDVPMQGFDNESDAWNGFMALPMYREIDGIDYWNGCQIGGVISCKQNPETTKTDKESI